MQHIILTALAEAAERHRIYRDTRILMTQSDHMLRDMGITRDDIPHVTGAMSLRHAPLAPVSKGRRWRWFRGFGSLG